MSSAIPVHKNQTIDLTWVEFSEEEAQPCMAVCGCDKEATWKAVFKFNCSCWPTEWFFCEEDGVIIKENHLGRTDGYCTKCLGPSNLASIFHWRKGFK